jgi:D-inositol-3-phosphate glycosyltransferase
VVAAAVGGLRWTVAHGVSGFLIPGHDPGPYARRVVDLLRDPGQAARLSIGARERALRFGWDRTVAGVLDAYAELAPDLLPDSLAS